MITFRAGQFADSLELACIDSQLTIAPDQQRHAFKPVKRSSVSLRGCPWTHTERGSPGRAHAQSRTTGIAKPPCDETGLCVVHPIVRNPGSSEIDLELVRNGLSRR